MTFSATYKKKIHNTKLKVLLYSMLNNEYDKTIVGQNIRTHNYFHNDRYIIDSDDELINPFSRDMYLRNKEEIKEIMNKYPPIIIKGLFPSYYNIDFDELLSI